MPQLFGTAPNQVPTNADLGTMAYREANQFYDVGQTVGFRNRIINGAMMVSQRLGTSSVTANNTGDYTLDRWKYFITQAGKFTVQQNAGSVTPPPGFRNYLGVTSTSAYSVISSDYFDLTQPIEGFNVADLGWGTANAQPITISFWVRSSLTGTFGGGVTNSAYNRSYPFPYTINTANTWEYKTVTIPGDTTGTWLTDNSRGIELSFGLGNGSSNSGTANTWQSSWAPAPTGAVSVVGTNGATLYITGVQLEKGSTATSFDYRPYGTELALCQRYFWRIAGDNGDYPAIGVGTARATNSVRMYIKHPVSMRTYPTFSFSGIPFFTSGGVGSGMSGISGAYEGLDTSMLDITTNSSTLTVGDAAILYADGSASSFVQASAEL